MSKQTVFFFGLSAIAGAAWAQGPGPTGPARTGAVGLTRISLSISAGPLGNIQSISDTFTAFFLFTDYSKFIIPDAPPPTTVGQCLVIPFTQPPDIVSASTALDAGPLLNLTGPNGTRAFAAKKFTFSEPLGGGTFIPGLPPPPPLYLDPGSYTVDNGAGGADVGPFMTTLTIPNTFTWTNADDTRSQNIDRRAGVDVAWTGGDPNSKVTIVGGVVDLDPETLMATGGVVYSCTEDNSAGHFFVSPDVLGLLPATILIGDVSNGILTVNGGVQAPFSATGIDAGVFIFSSLIIRNPAYN